jgi:ubiquinone/menaquinone biosynthesis C-methylase UbiE
MFLSLLNAKQGDVLLDIGCGKGGPGLRIAEQKKLKLVGIDIIPEAIHNANLLKENFALNYQPKFEEGGFCEIPMASNSVDAVISIDAFWMVKNKVKALMEIRRVMKSGAQFIFTTCQNSQPFTQSLLMESHGFQVISKVETENWKTYQVKVYRDILKHKDQLLKEMGEAAKILISEATTVPLTIDFCIRRFYHASVNK